MELHLLKLSLALIVLFYAATSAASTDNSFMSPNSIPPDVNAKISPEVNSSALSIDNSSTVAEKGADSVKKGGFKPKGGGGGGGQSSAEKMFGLGFEQSGLMMLGIIALLAVLI